MFITIAMITETWWNEAHACGGGAGGGGMVVCVGTVNLEAVKLAMRSTMSLMHEDRHANGRRIVHGNVWRL